MNKLKTSHSSSLLSQTIPNPNSKPSTPPNYGKSVRFIDPSQPSTSSPQPSSSQTQPSFTAKGITLRSGKNMVRPSPPHIVEEDPTSDSDFGTDSDVPLPFPEALNEKEKKLKLDTSNIEGLFKQIVIHLPLFKAIEHILAYAKFLK